MYIRHLLLIILLFLFHSTSYGMYRVKTERPASHTNTDRMLRSAWTSTREFRDMEIRSDIASIVLTVGFFNNNLKNNVHRKQGDIEKAITSDRATHFFYEQLSHFFLKHLPRGKKYFTMADLGKASFDMDEEVIAVKKVLLVLSDLNISSYENNAAVFNDPEILAIDNEIIRIFHKIGEYISVEVLHDLQCQATELRSKAYDETIYTKDLLPEVVFHPDQIKVPEESVHFLTNTIIPELYRRTLRMINSDIIAKPQNHPVLSLAKELKDFYTTTPRIFNRYSRSHVEDLIAVMETILYRRYQLQTMPGDSKGVRAIAYTQLNFADIQAIIKEVIAFNWNTPVYTSEQAEAADALSWLVVTAVLIKLSDGVSDNMQNNPECQRHFREHLDRLAKELNTDQMIIIYSLTGRWLGKTAESSLPELTKSNAFTEEHPTNAVFNMALKLKQSCYKEFMYKTVEYFDEYLPKTDRNNGSQSGKRLANDPDIQSAIMQLDDCSASNTETLDQFFQVLYSRVVRYPSKLMLNHIMVAINQPELAVELGR